MEIKFHGSNIFFKLALLSRGLRIDIEFRTIGLAIHTKSQSQNPRFRHSLLARIFQDLGSKTINSLYLIKSMFVNCVDSDKMLQNDFNNEPAHEIYNNVVCATSKASDQPAHTRSLIRAFAGRLSIL